MDKWTYYTFNHDSYYIYDGENKLYKCIESFSVDEEFIRYEYTWGIADIRNLKLLQDYGISKPIIPLKFLNGEAFKDYRGIFYRQDDKVYRIQNNRINEVEDYFFIFISDYGIDDDLEYITEEELNSKKRDCNELKFRILENIFYKINNLLIKFQNNTYEVRNIGKIKNYNDLDIGTLSLVDKDDNMIEKPKKRDVVFYDKLYLVEMMPPK